MIARGRVHLSRGERGERPGALLARGTRTLRTCSPGIGARLGALGVGCALMMVKWTLLLTPPLLFQPETWLMTPLERSLDV